MNETIVQEVELLRAAPLEQIRRRYRGLFGEEPRLRHRESLVRRIAWRLQASAEGGLSERARQRALEIANDAAVRLLPPRGVGESQFDSWFANTRSDRRIPTPGSVLSREYGGRTISVKVLARGFEYESREYRSLSAIATEVTGTRWNGLAFFGLTGRRTGR